MIFTSWVENSYPDVRNLLIALAFSIAAVPALLSDR